MAAELFVGPVVEKLIDIGFHYLEGQCRWQTGMKKELASLRDNYDNFKAVDFASIRAQIRDEDPDFNNWLWQLRDAIDEADDVLDEFEYMNHERQLMKNKKQRKVRFVMKFIKSRLVKIVKRALQIDPNLKRLEEVVKKLDSVLVDIGRFQNLLQIRKEEQREQLQELNRTRQAGALPTTDLIGRRKDKKSVIQWLKKTSSEPQTTLYGNISLLSIVGHGGMGKTTLAQHVYNEMTTGFDLKIWVCVSNNFDAQKVIADMLEYIKKERLRANSLDTLQESLKSEVASKKFLLVLDDIWAAEEEESDKSKWKNVFAPLACGLMGSKILITTRMYSIASMIAKLLNKNEGETILKLEGLEEDKCLQLLNSYAFANVENYDDHKHLRSISGLIVKKLSGSPLAAKVIGNALNQSLDERHWLNILNSDIMRAESGQNILSLLRLSYLLLPKHLQSCFGFCCIFSRDHEFDKDDLVRMWIALGFILPSNNQKEIMEDIGGRYFDDLVRKSFFDEFQNHSKTYYMIHDLLHESVQSVSAQECLRVMSNEESPSRIPESIRHLNVETDNLEMLKNIGKFKHLRSLFLKIDMDKKESFDALTEIFKSLRRIRLLYIIAHGLKEIPAAIENLIHLRYLNFNAENVTQLPPSLCKLYRLQFMIYGKKNMLPYVSNDFFPRDMNNLANLHYLKLPWNRFSGMHGIGKLNSLQELNEFYVKNEAGHTIKELERMNELRQLDIRHLENVKDAEQAHNAKLCDKRNLTDLSLQWRGDVIFRRNFANNDLSLVQKVLDNLQPCNSLKKLRIHSFMGVRSAEWMNNVNLMSNLEWIELENCLEWQTLPPFGKLPSLKSLSLLDMPKVKRLDGQFPSLEVLRIRGLEALEDWFDAQASNISLFPSLTELRLINCPNSKELPYLPPKLESLEVVKVGWKTLNFCSMSESISLTSLTIMDCPRLISLGRQPNGETTETFQLELDDLSTSVPYVLLREALRSVTSLRRLRISGNDELVSFPDEVDQWFRRIRASFRELEFTDLKSLQSLPSSLESLALLEILIIRDIPELQVLPKLPDSLKRLDLSGLKSLQCLPPSLSSMSALKSLSLSYIPLLMSLPKLPPSLKDLFIFGCHKKLKERYDSTSGVDRDKLARIPRVSI